MFRTRIRRLLSRSDSPATRGWATSSLEQSLREAVTLLTAALSFVVGVGLLIGAPATTAFEATAALFLGVGLLAVLCLFVARISPLLPLVSSIVATMIGYSISPGLDHFVTFVLAWVTNFTSIAVVLLVRGWPGFLIVMMNGGLCGAVLAVAHPSWPPTLTQGAPVTQAAIAVAGLVGMHYFRSFAQRSDAQSAAAQRDQDAAKVAITASHAAAESARVLHDTVINTLGAIANGGRINSDRDRVRDRCARDISTIKGLLNGQERAVREDWEQAIVALGSSVGVDVYVSGPSDATTIDTVPPPVLAAINGALHEVLLNVAKHSGVARASVIIESAPPLLTIRAEDDGVGLGTEGVAGFGIRESIRARCRAHGVDVRIDSSENGGTSVRFDYAREALEAAPDGDFEKVVAVTQNRACWSWAWGVTGVGVAIEFTNHFGTFGMTWAMVGLLAVVTAISQLSCRHDRPIPRAVEFLLILSTPTTFVFSLAGVGFGEHDVILWQLLGTSVPMIILLYQSRSMWPAVWSAAAHVVVGLGVAVAMVHSPSAGIVAFGVLVPLATAGGFVRFHGDVERIGAHAIADQRSAAAARQQMAMREAADNARLRWKVAGLQATLDLLTEIVLGTADPTDTRIQARCAAEERYLRQLLMLSPDLLHFGYWFTRITAIARTRGIELNLRAGDTDAPNAAVAAAAGLVIVAEINQSVAGSKVTVGLFVTRNGGCVTVVRDQCTDPHVPSVTSVSAMSISTQVLDNQRFVEVTWENTDLDAETAIAATSPRESVAAIA